MHIGEAVVAVGMAGNLRLLPGRQLGIGVDQRLLRLLLQLGDLLGDRHRAVLLAVQRLEIGDLALELGDRLLEVEIGANGYGTAQQLAGGWARGREVSKGSSS